MSFAKLVLVFIIVCSSLLVILSMPSYVLGDTMLSTIIGITWFSGMIAGLYWAANSK